MKKYRVSRPMDGIEEYEIVKETNKTVTYLREYKGNEKKYERKEAKEASHHRWFDSWQEAKDHIVKIAGFTLEAAKLNLAKAEETQARVNRLADPSHDECEVLGSECPTCEEEV